MNDVIKQLTAHTSVRQFETTPLSNEVKQTLIAAAQSGSSSNFVQAYTFIDVTDLALRQEIENVMERATHVTQTGAFYVVVADLYRHAKIVEQAGLPLDSIANMDSLIIAIADATIAAQNMVVAAESMGLGICYIGGIRNDMNRIAELLDLPPYTVPLFGLTIGVPTQQNEVKPRLPQVQVVAENRYTAALTDMTAYENTTREYYATRGNNQQATSWTDKIQTYFGVVHRADVVDFIRKQGFNLG